MRFRRIISCLLCLMLAFMLAGSAAAETIDCSSSRHDYARAISQLNQQSVLMNGGTNLRKRGTLYTLVLFRTQHEVDDWGELQPDVLAAGPHNCYTAAYKDPDMARMAVEFLLTLPDMIYAELDTEVHSCGTEEGSSQSFHSHGAAKMGFAEAVKWTKQAGAGSVLVAVIDSGIYPHPFLSRHLSASGYDYVDGDEEATNDTYGHGTHVAGIIVDCTYGLPVLLKPIRVLNAEGKGSVSNTVCALMEAAESGAKIINLSLVSSTHSEALENAVTYAVGRGCAVVASAGNKGDLTSRYCPVHMETNGLIVVGACTGTMDNPEQAGFSNYGPSVDVFAFGSSISSCSLSGGYTTQTGTSQAAPHISALCAILKMLFPSLSGSQMETRVKLLAGDGEVNIPDASLLKPQTLGLTAERVTLPAGSTISLMHNPPPRQSMITITWSCDDPSVATVDAGNILHCLAPGTTILRGNGPAKEVVRTELTVAAGNEVIMLPTALKTLEEEAMAGSAAFVVILPDRIAEVSPTAFIDSDIRTIIYSGRIDSIPFKTESACWVVKSAVFFMSVLEENGIPYILDCAE